MNRGLTAIGLAALVLLLGLFTCAGRAERPLPWR